MRFENPHIYYVYHTKKLWDNKHKVMAKRG